MDFDEYEGRFYPFWWNENTNESVWEEPAELKGRRCTTAESPMQSQI